jgi:hypothetical protein
MSIGGTDMTASQRSASCVLVSALAATAAAGLASAPLAHADPLDGIRGAVNGSRAQSTCSALTYNLDLEAAAQQIARSSGYIHVNPHGYQGNTQANLVRNDPTDKATEELVAQEVGPIHDCSYKDFGVGMFRDTGNDESVVTVVLGRPAAPPPPPASGPTYAPQAPQTAHVVGGDLAVFNIAHDDTKDPATGVQGLKIATLPNGTDVTFDGVCKTGWCRIKSPLIAGGFGFAEEKFLMLD